MTSEERSFTVGTKVLRVSTGMGARVSEAVVARVYKTGNFLLEGSSQQYRPGGWATGDGYSKPHVILADTEKGRRVLADYRHRLVLRSIDDFAVRMKRAPIEAWAEGDREDAARICKELRALAERVAK